MFESPLLERLSKIHPATVPLLYVPVIIAFIVYALAYAGLGVGQFLLLFASGLVFWSLFEYLFHRFFFHFQPASSFGYRLQFIVHGVHHQYPRDKERLVMPIGVSISIAVALWFVFEAVFGARAFGFFPGFVFGYLCYDMIHFSIHHFKLPANAVLKRVWLHHLDHHYRDPGKGFGVSSPLWDYVFYTRTR